jgi:hypothetical protein
MNNYTYPKPFYIAKIDTGASYHDPHNKVKDSLIEATLEEPDIASEVVLEKVRSFFKGKINP